MLIIPYCYGLEKHSGAHGKTWVEFLVLETRMEKHYGSIGGLNY